MAKRILVATDLSEQSLDVLRAAQKRAVREGATLAVCHVVPEAHLGSTLFPHMNQGAVLESADFERQARAAAESFVAKALPSATPELFFERGAPSSEIVRRAQAFQADLIVTGSTTKGLERAILGSVAARVVRYAHCPVLVVRGTAGKGGILAATDLSDASMPALVAASAEAQRTGAQLTVVHVIDSSWADLGVAAGSPFGLTPPSPSQELRSELLATATSLLTQAMQRMGIEGQALALEGSPASAIVRQAQELDAELLVVGTRGKTGLERIWLGSVAEQVIAEASCSVLAVRQNGA